MYVENGPWAAGHGRRQWAALWVLLRWTAVLGISLGGFSCAFSRPVSVPPPEPAARDAFEVARGALRELEASPAPEPKEAKALRRRALDALAEAAALDPSWAAPRRFEDDLARRDLRGPWAYGQRLDELEMAVEPALPLYLVGRLEPNSSAQRFAQALAADPSLAWAHHGLSVEHQAAGRDGPALSAARRAFDRARGGFEASLFARRLADLWVRAGREAQALGVLERARARADLGSLDAFELELALALLELDSAGQEVLVERGYRRGLVLLGSGRLVRSEFVRLLEALRAGRAGRSAEAWSFDVRDALTRSGAPERFGIDRRALAEPDLVLLSFALSSDAAPLDAAAQRLAGVRRGETAAAVEAWRAALPEVVRGADGMPRDSRLAEVVQAARALDSASKDSAALAAFARAALAAGWFDEALAVVGALARAEPGRADLDELERAARSGSALVGDLAHAIGAVQANRRSWWFEPNPEPRAADEPVDAGPAVHARGEAARSLGGLLEGLASLAQTYGGPLGVGGTELAERIRRSPGLDYGPFATVLVPGPTFTGRDQVMGVGTAGETVPGLAELLDRLGRAALIGDVVGQRPDGTLLRRLAHGVVSGTRLGVPFEGMVIWCEGTEVSGGLARLGGLVSGAALHEGYWIDVESERRRLARWRDLEARFLAPGAEAELASLLALPGLELGGDPAVSELARLERSRLAPPLGAADRLRLTMLAERRAAGAPTVSLDELLEVVAVHEEGHLLDRTRFLPLGANLWGVLGLGLRAGLSPGAIERELERRAQLVALCELEDPRFALVDLLDAAEIPRASAGAHARAYSQLLGEFLVELDRQMDRDAEAFGALDRSRTLVHQLHRLSPAQVRVLALELARRSGVASDG